jgi:type I restriction enzyme M protein
LQGTIRAGNEAISYYQDPHELAGRCDFVMANPPFNVDEVDADKVKSDKRLPFGLPGVNKQKKVSNANYLWLQYFFSYLNENGRAGVVMSSQASSSGRDEAKVRQKLVESGAVDVMIDIRSNFFYTRTVPCQLWFFDRAKERDPARVDQVLMLDARNIYRKISRAIYDFSPEQQKNIAAIIWLYRGRQGRFLALVESYLQEAINRGRTSHVRLSSFVGMLAKLTELLRPFVAEPRDPDPLIENWREFLAIQATLTADIDTFVHEFEDQAKAWSAGSKPDGRENLALHNTRNGLSPLSDRCRDLTKRIDLVAKLIGRLIDSALQELEARNSALWANAEVTKTRKALEGARIAAVESLRQVRYFVKQADWLQERFPDAQLRDVEGLVKVVTRFDIATADGSLTPGRYVGVAPEIVDEDFELEEALRSIHIDLKGLNEEATVLAGSIERNFEDMGL